MSEYQYYEFLSVDRPLDAAARARLREISSRARITASAFVNHYDYGDLKADPLDLLARYFDLHVYIANWGSRHFAMKVPRTLLDTRAIARFQLDDDFLSVTTAGEHTIISVTLAEREPDDVDDGEGWMAALAPLRAQVLAGDLRMFYLLWLKQVGLEDFMRDDAPEPMAGLAPLDPALETFASFLDIDPDLLAAATLGTAVESGPDPAAIRRAIERLPDSRKTDVLMSLFRGDDPHLAHTFRRALLVGQRDVAQAPARRTAADLRAAALDARLFRMQKEAEEKAIRERREAAQAEAIKRRRQQSLMGREAEAWTRVERLIEQRNASGYAEAVSMISDLRDIASDGARFTTRLQDLRARHAAKRSLMTRLGAIGLA